MIRTILLSLFQGLRSHQSLVLENLALRHQVQVLSRGGKRPRLQQKDRLLWVLFSRLWTEWRSSLVMVKPETVIRWHRRGFRAYWRRKSQRTRLGRPRLTLDEREIIRQMARENPLWGAPRIHGELAKIGFEVSQTTVSKYMKQVKPKPSQSWSTFLKNHAREMVAIDFFGVPTATMKSLSAFVVLSLDRRKILGFGVTDSPTGAWAAKCLLEALKFENAPTIVLRDRDQKFGDRFDDAMKDAGLRQVLSAHRCPWQNGHVERVIGTLRRECLDHVIIFNARHLETVLGEYVAYYNGSRTHLGIEKDCPVPRPIEAKSQGGIVALPVLGGLHHRYTRRAA